MAWTKQMRGFTFVFVMLSLLGACSCWGYNSKNEEKQGKQYAKEVDEESTFVTDKAIVERVQRIGDTLAKIANEQEVPAKYGSSALANFKYQFKVIEDDDINAFSLPGGYIYINSGVIKVAESDDEIAGVIAHEIAHSAHHHMAQLMEKQSKMDKFVALIALAGILGNVRSNDLNNLFMGAQMMRTGKISGYTMQAEKDADRTAVAYMAKSPYNPEGLLSFMKKLDAKHDENPTEPMGIYQTHPAPYRRVAAITKAMKAEGIKVDMRQARGVAFAKSVLVDEANQQYGVVINKKMIYEPATLPTGTSSKSRAEILASKINKMLDSGVAPKDICENDSGTCLIAKGAEIIKVESEDNKQNSKESRALLDRARSGLAYAVWADWLCNDCEIAQEESLDDSD